jgi:carboxyl-terminal processing protease
MKYRILIIAALAGFLFSGTTFAQEKEKPSNNVETYRLLDLFGEVFERVRSGYVESPTDQELIESAISGMLTSLDPHSSYMSAKSFRDMQVQTRGAFGGLGIEVTMEAGLVKVVSPIDGTPAHKAGLKPGDYISHLDGKPILGQSLAEAVEKMRGKVGTDLRLTIRRKGTKAFDVTVTRAVIKIRAVRSRMEGKIGYLRITSFNEQADKGSIKALAKFKKEAGDDLKGLVLDLRNNPGGLLDQSVKISDLFLDKGEIVSTRSRRAEDTQRFNAHTGDLVNGLPIVVLINGGSASASEIVAGALQDHGRAILLGTKTFGKGSVQTIIPLSGHGAMRLTTARYYTPSGRSIQAVGIEPDIAVEQAKIESLTPRQTRREADLKGALKNENGGSKKKGDDPTGVNSKEKPQDYQLSRALDLIRGLALFNKKRVPKNQKAEATQ